MVRNSFHRFFLWYYQRVLPRTSDWKLQPLLYGHGRRLVWFEVAWSAIPQIGTDAEPRVWVAAGAGWISQTNQRNVEWKRMEQVSRFQSRMKSRNIHQKLIRNSSYIHHNYFMTYFIMIIIYSSHPPLLRGFKMFFVSKRGWSSFFRDFPGGPANYPNCQPPQMWINMDQQPQVHRCFFHLKILHIFLPCLFVKSHELLGYIGRLYILVWFNTLLSQYSLHADLSHHIP